MTSPHIYPHTPVRVRGVDVGTVGAVKALPGGGVDLALKITKDGVDLRRDARANVYERTLLGRNMYVELEPGSSRASLGGAAIPTSRTGSQVELDQVFQALQPTARAGQKRFFNELGDGLNTTAAHASIHRAPSGLAKVAAAAAATRGQHAGRDVPRLVAGGRKTVDALAREEEQLASLLDAGDTVLGVTAARHADLGRIVADSPRTLSVTRSAMTRLRTTLDRVDRVSAALRPGLRATAPAVTAASATMRAVSRLVPVALPAVTNMRPALASLREASHVGAPLTRELLPTLRRTSDEIVPFLDRRAETTGLKNYETIGPFFGAIASSASTYDAGGYMQRFQPGQRLVAPNLPLPSCERRAPAGHSRAVVASACRGLLAGLRVAILGTEPPK
jgi:virulence factor Mce-like protein